MVYLQWLGDEGSELDGEASSDVGSAEWEGGVLGARRLPW